MRHLWCILLIISIWRPVKIGQHVAGRKCSGLWVLYYQFRHQIYGRICPSLSILLVVLEVKSSVDKVRLELVDEIRPFPTSLLRWGRGQVGGNQIKKTLNAMQNGFGGKIQILFIFLIQKYETINKTLLKPEISKHISATLKFMERWEDKTNLFQTTWGCLLINKIKFRRWGLPQ